MSKKSRNIDGSFSLQVESPLFIPYPETEWFNCYTNLASARMCQSAGTLKITLNSAKCKVSLHRRPLTLATPSPGKTPSKKSTNGHIGQMSAPIELHLLSWMVQKPHRNCICIQVPETFFSLSSQSQPRTDAVLLSPLLGRRS